MCIRDRDKRGIDVTALWGGTVIGVERLSGPGEIIIGEGPAARFQIAHTSIPGTHFSLVRLGGAGARLHVAPGMRATIDGIAVEGEVALKTGQVGRIVVGPIEFVVQYSRRSSTAIVGLSEVLDFFYSKILAVALILQLGFVMALMITPMFSSMDGQELGMTERDVTKLILQAEQKLSLIHI